MSSLLSYLWDTLVYVNIFAILALSLNIEAGQTRLLNFGKVAFFAIGAYTTALLTMAGAPFIVGVAGAMVLAGVMGALLSIPALKLREDFLAIASIAFGEIIRLILLNERWLTNGPIGLRGIPQPLRSGEGLSGTLRTYVVDGVFGGNYEVFFLALTLAALAGVYLVMLRVARSPYGRVLKAIREDELVALTLGKDTFRFKSEVLVMGSAVAGLAGALFAHYITFIAPVNFMPTVTFAVWTMMVMGGMGNLNGVVLGAALVQLFERSTRFIKDFVELPVDPVNFRMVVLGLLLIFFIMHRPWGIIPERPMEVGDE
ncbi:MAG: branched-chain amino acid ABC transporter permease [Euryarchaeota archaeon]|nr:branched-chain amino acid ABC transporter permease [Euryarchaeota archaeon]